MAKYILKYSDLQRGDIIIDREDSDESRKIRKYTHSRNGGTGTCFTNNRSQQ